MLMCSIVLVTSSKLCYDEFREMDGKYLLNFKQRKIETIVVEIGDLVLENIRHSKYVEKKLKLKTTDELLKIQGVVFLSLVNRLCKTYEFIRQGKISFRDRMSFPEHFNSSIDNLNHFVMTRINMSLSGLCPSSLLASGLSISWRSDLLA